MAFAFPRVFEHSQIFYVVTFIQQAHTFKNSPKSCLKRVQSLHRQEECGCVYRETGWPHGYSVHSERSLWWLMPGGRFGDRSPPVGSRPPALQQAISMEAPPEPQEPPQRTPASPYSGCFLDRPWPGRLLGQGAPSFSQTSTHLPADIKPGLCLRQLAGSPTLALTEQGCVPFLSGLWAQMGGAAGAAAPAEAPAPVSRHGAGTRPLPESL